MPRDGGVCMPLWTAHSELGAGGPRRRVGGRGRESSGDGDGRGMGHPSCGVGMHAACDLPDLQHAIPQGAQHAACCPPGHCSAQFVPAGHACFRDMNEVLETVQAVLETV